jgi:cytoskeletal protein RodZ
VNRGLRSVGLFILAALVITLVRLHTHHTSTTPPSSTTTTSTSTTTTSTTPPSSTTTTSTSTTTTTASPAPCTPSQLSGTFALGTGSAGTVTGTISFHNSRAACALSGAVTWSALSTTGAPVTLTVSEPSTPHVTVPAGQSAGVQLSWSDVPQGTAVCPSVKTLRVSVGASGPLSTTLVYPITPCEQGHLSVGAWQA